MKYSVFFIMLVAAFSMQPVRSQEQGERPPNFEKFDAMRIAFITERLELSSAEAEKFWPVYNEYQKLKQGLRDEMHALHQNFNDNNATLSDKETEDILAKHMELQKKETALDVQYNEKFREVLSARKVMKLYMAEMHFKSFLLHQIRGGERRGQPDQLP